MKPPTPSRYQWTYRNVTFDFYRLCSILNLASEPQKHAIKKLIRAGQSIKSTTQDINEAIDALNRWKEMLEEDNSPVSEPITNFPSRRYTCTVCGANGRRNNKLSERCRPPICPNCT